MTSKEQVEIAYEKYLMPTYAPELTLVRGQGTRVWDAADNVYLDFTTGIAVLNLGHCHPRVVEAIREQAGRLIHVSNLQYNECQAQLAEKLWTISDGYRSFFCNSGAEGNEALIKLARLWGNPRGRYEVISMRNSFHGRTLATLTATGQAKVQAGFEPFPEGFRHADLNDLPSVQALVTDATAAILVEAIQAEGGVVEADAAFMAGLRELCDEQDILLLCDEVQCGMGRCGEWFGFEATGAVPDAFSLAKALGNGFPIGAALAGPRLAETFQPGNHATTFGGTPLACAAACAVVDAITEENLVASARNRGANWKKSLGELSEKYEYVDCVRGRGFLLGLVLSRSAKGLADCLTRKGLLTIPTAGNVLRLLPPLNVSDEDLEEALALIDDALDEWHATADETAQVGD